MCETLQEHGSALALLTEEAPAKACTDWAPPLPASVTVATSLPASVSHCSDLEKEPAPDTQLLVHHKASQAGEQRASEDCESSWSLSGRVTSRKEGRCIPGS